MDQIKELESSLRYAKTDLEKGNIHNNLGVIYEKLGKFQNALHHHKKELKFSRESPNQRMLACRFIAEIYRK